MALHTLLAEKVAATKSREVAQCFGNFLVLNVAGFKSRAKFKNKKSGDLIKRKSSKQKVAGI